MSNLKYQKLLLSFILLIFLSACSSLDLNASEQKEVINTIIPTVTIQDAHVPTRTPTPIPTSTPTPIPTLPPGVHNSVEVYFINTFRYRSNLQTFTNHEVSGFLHYHAHLQNTLDESGSPIYGLALEFSIEPGMIILDNIREEYLEISDPPVFKWFFGNVPEEPIWDIYMSEGYIETEGNSGTQFTPGFDASISVDKMTFPEPDAQEVTLTIVPRQELSYPHFLFHLGGGTYGDNADVVITSLEPGEHRGPAGERIAVTSDRKDIMVSDLELTINESYQFTMTLQVDPQKRRRVYLPYVSITWLPGGANRGTELGNSLTIPIDRVGSWTWTSFGKCLWEWQGPELMYEVSFN